MQLSVKVIFVIKLLIFFSIYCNAQQVSDSTKLGSDSIIVRKAYRSSTKFMYHGTAQKLKSMMKIMQPFPEAYKEIKLAQSENETVMGLVYVGGGLAVYSIGICAYNKKPLSLVSIGVGSGMMLLAIPYYFKFSKHRTKAIQLYNSQIKPASSFLNSNFMFKVGINGNGIGMQLSF